jgi:cell cycle checkpoint protein
MSLATTALFTEDQRPLFTAVSSSARQLYQLLKCINFSSKGYVEITKDGLKVSAQDSQVMQGV